LLTILCFNGFINLTGLSWQLTLDVDPDDEFVWKDEPLQKVYRKFDELVEQYSGAPCNEYTLRLIGSDLEHFMRQLLMVSHLHFAVVLVCDFDCLLQAGEISYNLNARVLNFSMGKPRVEGVERGSTV
jgi:NAD(P)H-quinone oxidoreductase subunit M